MPEKTSSIDFHTLLDQTPVNYKFIKAISIEIQDYESPKERVISFEDLGISNYNISSFYKVISKPIDLNSHE